MKPIPILMTEDEPTDEQLAALEARAIAELANQKKDGTDKTGNSTRKTPAGTNVVKPNPPSVF